MKKTSVDTFAQTIVEYCAANPGAPRKPRKLARILNVAEGDYPDFRQAFKALRRDGKLGKAVKGETVTGRFTANPRGFGFVAPEGGKKEDIFISRGDTSGALTGDLVVVRRIPPPRRGARGVRKKNHGEVIEVLERMTQVVVGTLEQVEGAWLLDPDGDKLPISLLITDFAVPPPPRGAPLKAVAEITTYPESSDVLPLGKVTEIFGEAGRLEAEIEAVLQARGIPRELDQEALAEAKHLVDELDLRAHDRRDLSQVTTITIDPVDARDFDDAISVERGDEGETTLGVHIADVASYVKEGSALDRQARERGTSVYFPHRVVPMLPPELSQGVCALAQDVPRRAVSVFITYDKEGEVLRRSVAATLIQSKRRLTYEEAQELLDKEEPGEIAQLLRELAALAKTIRRRRLARGMLSLDLPEVSLRFDDEGRVRDAQPTRHIFTHTLIEMFMVEANEAVTALLSEKEATNVMRRVHPAPSDEGVGQLVAFLESCGQNIDEDPPSRRSLQKLVDSLRGKPLGYAVNLAILRSMQQASYSIEPEGHYALASRGYCHFTSPIRRYPDLVVHRMVYRELLRRTGEAVDSDELAELANHCTMTERRAEAAERELRLVMVLHHLASKRGAIFEGVVTGVTDFGLFVQSPRYLVEGLLRRDDLEGWWTISASGNELFDQESGRTYRLGDRLKVRIHNVDVRRRHLDLKLAGRESV